MSLCVARSLADFKARVEKTGVWAPSTDARGSKTVNVSNCVIRKTGGGRKLLFRGSLVDEEFTGLCKVYLHGDM